MASRLCQRLRESSVLVQLAPSYGYSRPCEVPCVTPSRPKLIRDREPDPAFGGEAGREGAECAAACTGQRCDNATGCAWPGACLLSLGRRAGAVARAPTLDSEARVWPVPLSALCVDHAVPGQATGRPGRVAAWQEEAAATGGTGSAPGRHLRASEVLYLNLTVISGALALVI